MSKNPGRMMVNPLTLFQKLKYFPFRFHWDFMPCYKELFYSFIILLPVMKKIEDLTYSPSNVKNYEKYLQTLAAEHEAHQRHLEGYYEDRHH